MRRNAIRARVAVAVLPLRRAEGTTNKAVPLIPRPGVPLRIVEMRRHLLAVHRLRQPRRTGLRGQGQGVVFRHSDQAVLRIAASVPLRVPAPLSRNQDAEGRIGGK